MLLVGLTGGIGSGKSTVSALLARHGAVVIDADQLAREAVAPGGAAYQGVVERFGEQILLPDSRVDRAALAAIVFADPEARKDLEALVHPVVRTRIAEALLDEAATDHIVVLDVPLLVESGRIETAATIVVDSPEEVALRRLVGQRGMSEQDVRQRMAAQVSRQQRLARADVVVDNSGSLEQLEREVDRAWAWLKQRNRAPSTAARDP